MLERTHIEKPVVDWAKARGILHLKLNLMGNTGWPDDQFLHLGSSVFIEFKRPGGDLKRNQPERIEELVNRGFTVGVFDDVKIATRFLGATLLSDGWRSSLHKTGLCWIALQARAWKDVSDLYGVPYSAGQGVRT
jgi:hypothetical protein